MEHINFVSKGIDTFSEHSIEIKPLSCKDIVKYTTSVLGDPIQNMERLVQFSTVLP